MGYTIHDAVIASLSDDRDDAAEVRSRFYRWRAGLSAGGAPHLTDEQVRGLAVGPIPWLVNDGATYLLACDGSKEGWEESLLGDRLRAEFVALFAAAEGVDVVSLRFGADYRRDGNDLPAARYEPSSYPLPGSLDDVSALVSLVVEYGTTDGAHHKQYALDQVLRAVAGDRYARIRAELAGDWDEGTA